MATEKHGEFGARLRDARERRGMSLRVIADATKISVRTLEALERNEIARLPGGIFSRGFVRAYALEVGLDPEQTIAEFITRFPDETVTQGHPRTRAIMDELESNSRRRSWSPLARVAALGGVAVVLLVLFAVVGRRPASVPRQPVAAASVQATPEAVSTAARFSVTLHARRSTRFSMAPDQQPSVTVELGIGASRIVEASRELLIIPADPSALEWSADRVAPRRMTGPLTLTPATIQSVAGRP